MVSLVLTFGIFFAVSCTYFEKSQNEEQLSYQEQIDQRIEEINDQLLSDPDNHELIAEKGELLIGLADLMANPNDRMPVYRNLYNLSTESDIVQSMVVKAWSEEQNSGVRLLQTERNDVSIDHYDEILGHFYNAITLQPDSMVTYSLLATTYYEKGSIHHAIETMETALEISGNGDMAFKEKLGYLYLEAGRTDESVGMYEDLVTEYPDDNHLLHGLINTYMISNRHDDAVIILKQLTEEYPTRYNYQEALATQLYFQFKEKSGMFSPMDEESDITAATLIDLASEIDTIFNSLMNNTPVNEENVYRMAAFYKNSAATLTRLSELSDTPEMDQEKFIEISNDFTEKSLSLWERLAEMNPDNLEYMTVLRQIYIENGMDEEAELIERSYNY